MILSDDDIIKELAKGNLKIQPGIDIETQLQPASVDLRLSNSFIINGEKEILDKVTVNPGNFILASTHEKVVIPDYLVGRVEGRSSYGRLGLLVHVSAGFIDPGFEGRITLEMVNLSKKPVTLDKGCRICQLVLEELRSPCYRPYGSKGLGSKYQNQYFPEESKVWLEK